MNPLTSNATFYGLAFNESRANTNNHNIRLSGTNAGLSWNMQNWSGVLGGKPHTDYSVQPSTRVVWSAIPGDAVLTAVYVTSVTVSELDDALSPSNGYELDASTAADFSGTIVSSSTTNSAVTTLTTPPSLWPNTTYYLRLGNIVSGTTSYANVTPASTSTLANVISGVQVYNVSASLIVVNWQALPVSPSSSTSEGYILQASTASNFSGTLFSSSTSNVSLSTLTLSGLAAFTTYYIRAGGLNWDSVADYAAAVSTVTPAPICAGAVIVDVVGPSNLGTSAGGATGLTWSHVSRGPNGFLTVGVAVGTGNDAGMSLAATYGGVSMSSAGVVHANNGNQGFVQLFYLVNPSTGSHTVAVALSGGSADLEGGSVSFDCVNATTPIQNIATNFGNAQSGGLQPTLNVTSQSGDMVVDAIANGSAINSSNQTYQWINNQNGNTAGGNGAQSTAAGAASVTMGYSVVPDWWGIIGMDLVAASPNTCQ